MAIYARLVDGPHEHPNGTLLVKLKNQGRLPDHYICEVIGIIQTSSRTCKVGDEIEANRNSLSLLWVHERTEP